MEDLSLKRSSIVDPGDRACVLDGKVRVIPVMAIETAFGD